MADLSTKYMGLTLRNPLIVASSGLTDSFNKIEEHDKNGAGAVVLKSLFEEQILLEAEHRLEKARKNSLMYAEYSETLDYIDLHIKEKELGDYLGMIRKIKKELLVPVIASINCISKMEWTGFAQQIEEAGADAIELNIFIMPFNMKDQPAAIEKRYYDIVKKVKAEIDIPLAVKLSPYFINLGQVIMNLEKEGANAVVLFNRFASPDIDIDKIKVTSAPPYSTPDEIYNSLRWIAMMSNRVQIDLAASTGIHDGEAVIKQLLAGASVVQVASALYKHGASFLPALLKFVDEWMTKNGFNYIDQFKGNLSQEEASNPDVFERLQFMKYFSEIT
jgi:dihydroorotate dehydrogenase (fumarate)